MLSGWHAKGSEKRSDVGGVDVEVLSERAERDQFKSNYFTEMCSGSEAGSCLRLTDVCITQL